MLFTLFLILALYIGPARSYFSTKSRASAQQAQVERLKRENHVLRARKAALEHPGVLEREARKLGMAKEGERIYILRGLPDGP